MKTTLDPREIATTQSIGRRSAMRAVAAVAIGFTATACHHTGCTDTDSGLLADAAGNGRRCGSPTPDAGVTGCSDGDPVSTGDLGGHGTHCLPRG